MKLLPTHTNNLCKYVRIIRYNLIMYFNDPDDHKLRKQLFNGTTYTAPKVTKKQYETLQNLLQHT